MGEADLFSLIGSLGFPIAVASYLIVKIDKVLQSINNTMNEFVITNREVLSELRKGNGRNE